ncbi:MAG: Hsp20/alpha crystallin family protein [Saprospiraceae bacterium]|nr:Hsp20/alpha crystallin family protein [Saprospiraceae bacterium]
MSLIKWNPELSFLPNPPSWMDDFFGDGDWFKPSIKGVSIPAVNVTESKKAFKLEVGAPGFKKDDFKIEVNSGYLTISGEHKSEKEEKDDKEEKITRREFSYSKFARSFTLPENVKSDDISAKYEDGILLVTLPKSKEEEKMPKTVAVG